MNCILAMTFALTALAAGVTGKWNVTSVAGDGREIKLAMTLSGEPGKLKGTLTGETGKADLEDIKLAGNELSFKFSSAGSNYQVKLSVDGDSMKGSYSNGQGVSGKMTATRAR